MSQITNKDLVKALFDGARMPVQETPSELGKTVVPVLDGTPDFHRKCNIVKGGAFANDTTAIVYTTPTDRDFYLNSANLSFIKSALNQGTVVELTIRIDGVTVPLLSVEGITLTAQSDNIGNSYPVPIKIDRGTAINITSNSAVAVVVVSGNITGYTVDIN